LQGVPSSLVPSFQLVFITLIIGRVSALNIELDQSSQHDPAGLC